MRVVVVRISVLGPRFALTRVLMLDRPGSVGLSLQVDAWSDEQLTQIYDALSLPVIDAGETLSARGINEVYPGAVSTLLRYSLVLALAAIAACLVAVAALALLLQR